MSVEMDDLIDALHRAAKTRGIGEVATSIGMESQTLRNKLRSNSDQLRFREVVAALHQVDPDEFLELLCQMFGRGLATRCQDRHSSVIGAVLHAMNEQADIGKAVEEALANDGVIDAPERARILRECAQARDAIRACENTVMACAPFGEVLHIDVPGVRRD